MVSTRADHHVFVSYRSLDRAFALKLSAALRNAGVALWADCLPEGIRPGDDWPRTLEDALNRCRALLAVLSLDYVASKICRRELHRADQLARPIVPLLLKPVATEQWPLEIERLQYVDFTNWRDDASFRTSLASLVDRLQSQSLEVIGQRPDAEQQYLITLIADLEARGGVGEYIPLAADVAEVTGSEKERTPIARRWGLDAEFTLLEAVGLDRRAAGLRAASGRRLDSVLALIATPRTFVLLGEPGAGKTTTLRRLALEAARARLADRHTAPLPLLLQLSHWLAEPDPLSFIESHWPFDGDARTAIASQDVIVFLDGLNEMGGRSGDRVERLKHWLRSPEGPARLAVTCRTRDYTPAMNLEIDEVTVLPMDAGRVHRFAGTYLHDGAAEFVGRLSAGAPAVENSRSLYPLARNPYLLTCLMVLHRAAPGGELPRNPGSLFRRLVENLWNRELIRQTRGWIPFAEAEPCFARLAFQMIEEDQPTHVPRRYVEDLLGNGDLVHVGLSASVFELDDDRIRFYHQLMQEYFAAVELARVGFGDRLEKRDFGFGCGMDGAWDNVVIARCGISQAPDAVVREVLARNPYLGARCIVSGIDVTEPVRRHAIQSLMRVLHDAVQRHGRTVFFMHEDEGQPGGLYDAAVRERATFVSDLGQLLREIDDVAAVEALLDVLGGDVTYRRDDVLELLRTMGPSAVPQLVDALRDKRTRVRAAAANVLGQIGDASTVPALSATVKADDSGEVRNEAALALGKIGDARAIPGLLEALSRKSRGAPGVRSQRDEDRTVRWNTIWALVRLGGPTAASRLFEALRHEADREVLVQQLERIGTPEALAAVNEWRRKMPRGGG